MNIDKRSTGVKAKVANGGKKSVENTSGWDRAIADAKERIKGLQFSIEVFEQYKKEGREWPGTSIPA